MATRLRHWLLHSGDGFLLPLVLLAFFWQLGTPPLFDLDEGAFSAATWEMLQRGDFITTYLNGAPRFDKPILIYWLQALSVSLFGWQEWTLRLPSALAASAWVITTYYFAKARMPQPQAALAALMLSCSAMVVIIGRAATADAVLNLLIALAIFDIWRYWEHTTRLRLFRVFFWLGLGFLCKGPIAVVIPFVVSAALYLSHGQWRTWLQTVFNPSGWVVFLAVAVPWYALAYLHQGQAFLDGFFLQHNVGRFTDTMEGHGGHVGYYVVALPLIMLPFSGLLMQLRWQQLVQAPLERFLLTWFGFVFVFFSLSSTQLPHYLLYGITPLLLLLAKYTGANPNRWLALVPAIAVAVVLIFLPELLAQAITANPNSYYQGLLAQFHKATGSYYRWAAVIYALALLALLLWRNVPHAWRLVGAAVMQTLFLVSVLIPAIAYTQQGAVKELARFANHHLQGSTVVMDGVNMPSFTVYRQAITPKRPPRVGEYVFSKEGQLQPTEAYTVVYRQGGLLLARRMQ